MVIMISKSKLNVKGSKERITGKQDHICKSVQENASSMCREVLKCEEDARKTKEMIHCRMDHKKKYQKKTKKD